MHVRGAMWVQGCLAHKLLNWRGEFKTTTHVGTVPHPLSLPVRWTLRCVWELGTSRPQRRPSLSMGTGSKRCGSYWILLETASRVNTLWAHTN